MIKSVALLFFALLSPVFAESFDFSLFLTPQELSEHKTEPHIGLDNNKHLKLNAIMFAGPHNWTIWLNNEVIKPDPIPEHIQIKNVTTEHVHFIWVTETGEHPLTLKINEVIDLTSLE